MNTVMLSRVVSANPSQAEVGVESFSIFRWREPGPITLILSMGLRLRDSCQLRGVSLTFKGDVLGGKV